MSVYRLKPAFQAMLRPLVGRLAALGVTANQVTLAAVAGSVLVAGLVIWGENHGWFLLVPFWFLLRMALNAVDGMLAREHGQQSALGAYLNELGDVVSDAALYLPFAFVMPFGAPALAALVFLAVLSEFAGVQGAASGATRRYDGPMGKSDRAVVFGALGAWIGLTGVTGLWTTALVAIVCVALVLTVVNRIRNGVREVRASGRRQG